MKASNRVTSAKRLGEHGVSFTASEDVTHLIIEHSDRVVDFFPGTGKFFVRDAKKTNGRGVFNLLRLLGVSP